MAAPPYPLEPVKDRYITPFGGFSPELGAGEVGVNRDALLANTALVPGRDEVLVSSDLDGRATPLFARPFFRVVAVDATMPRALSRSPAGEVVFSDEDYGGSRASLFDALRSGALVVLNATLSRRLGSPGVFAKRRFRES